MLDRMQYYEMAALLDHAWRRERGAWERTRFVAYITAQSQSTKALKPTDVLPLPWDGKDEEEEVPDTAMSEVERRRLIDMAKHYEKIING